MKKAIAVSILLAGAFLLIISLQSERKAETWAQSTVKIVTGGGHGSGVNLGRGYILTAAHVVSDQETISVSASHGGSSPARVLWANKEYDVALLSVSDMIGVAESPLSCRQTGVGQSVRASGNPGPLEYITSWGRISSTELKRGPWQSTVIIDLTIAPGSSGGPVFDTRGNVVGIVVGIAMMPDGFSRSAIPFSYVVPSTAICMLMART